MGGGGGEYANFSVKRWPNWTFNGTLYVFRENNLNMNVSYSNMNVSYFNMNVSYFNMNGSYLNMNVSYLNMNVSFFPTLKVYSIKANS